MPVFNVLANVEPTLPLGNVGGVGNAKVDKVKPTVGGKVGAAVGGPGGWPGKVTTGGIGKMTGVNGLIGPIPFGPAVKINGGFTF